MATSERVLRIGFIREHFSSPLLQLADEDAGKTFTLVECPSGTGQVISRLVNDEIDVAIALTDPLLAGIINGSSKGSYKLVGSYVMTPLNWAVVTGIKSKYENLSQLEGTTIGISRIGSGSHTMANVMALQQGWLDPSTGLVKKMEFKINNDIHGLNTSVNDDTTSAYMWEWFTTKPWADRGEVRFIGSVPTPWPSWMIAAHPSQDRAPTQAVISFLERLTGFVRAFDSAEARSAANVEFIKERFGYPEADIKAWLGTVKYTADTREIRQSVIHETIKVLGQTGFIPSNTNTSANEYVDEKVCKLVTSANPDA
ncbi:hypothetical protein DL93DRAFT_2083800 [Clavulina sp. PMI_390]|nr:hypothetical protein DL93DRAFT_2083800 [Clavulina sp. PMI_390]